MQDVKDEFDWISFDVSDMEIGAGRTVDIPIVIKNIQSGKRKFSILVKQDFTQKDELVEWFISLETPKIKEFTVSPKDKQNVEEDFEIESKGTRKIGLIITAPKGAYMNDQMALEVRVASEDGVHSLTKNFKVNITPVIIALKTTVGNEIQVAKDLKTKGDKDKEDRRATNEHAVNEVLAIMAPHDVKGYAFVETMHPDRIAFIARGIRGFKGIVEGDIQIDEIVHYLTPKPAVAGLELGAFVELIDGPFKGEKAKIISIDSAKEEVTVQLIESMVPIPVTVRAEAIRMLDRK